MAKKFEDAVLIESFEAVEGIFAGSGNTPVTPPPEKTGSVTSKFTNHDSGTLTELEINGKGLSKGSHSVTVNIIDSSMTIDHIEFNGGGDGTSWYQQGSTIYITFNCRNDNENPDCRFTVYYKHSDGYVGAYYKSGTKQTGDTMNVGEMSTNGILNVDFN